jgi:hypothetical protein
MTWRFLRSKPFYFWFGIVAGLVLIACVWVYTQRQVFNFRYKDKVGQVTAGETAWLDGHLRPLGYGMASSGSLDCRWNDDPKLDLAVCFAAVDVDGQGIDPLDAGWLEGELDSLDTALKQQGWQRMSDDYRESKSSQTAAQQLEAGGSLSIHYAKQAQDGITCDFQTSFNREGRMWVSELRCQKQARFFLLQAPSREV